MLWHGTWMVMDDFDPVQIATLSPLGGGAFVGQITTVPLPHWQQKRNHGHRKSTAYCIHDLASTHL